MAASSSSGRAPGWDARIPAALRPGGRAERRTEVERYLRRAGLPELCRGETRWFAWSGGFFAAFVLFCVLVYNAGQDSWSETKTVLVNGVGVGLFSASLTATINGLALHRPRSLLLRAGIWLAIASLTAMAVLVAVLVAAGALGKGTSAGFRPSNLTLALLAAGPVVLAVLGGLSLFRAAVVSACSAGLRDLSSMMRTAPGEMFFLVVFVIILHDTRDSLGGLDGWRVELLLLGCTVAATVAIALRLGDRLRRLTELDPITALDEARSDPIASELVRGLTAEGRARRALRGRARWNAVLLVILPLTVRLIAAAMLMTVLLFVIGLLLMRDSVHAPDAISAVKVAALLSGLAAVAFTVGDKGAFFVTLGERRIAALRPALAVWALRCDDASGAAPAR